jgi:hypothetical protein
MGTTAAKKFLAAAIDAPEVSVSDRKAPIIKAESLMVNETGALWKCAMVQLPDGAVFQDLQDSPEMWRHVQSNPHKSLRFGDRVTCIAFDRSWGVKDAFVADADSGRVVLAIKSSDKITLSSKSGTWEDEKHLIKWDGAGFAVFRKYDGVRVLPSHFTTLDAAKSAYFGEFHTKKIMS